MLCNDLLKLCHVPLDLLQDLKRNGVDTPEAIYNIIYSGKSVMSW